MSEQDTTFLKTFSVVVGGLALFAVLLIALAAIFDEQLRREVSEARLQATEERIQPVGAVHTGEEGARAPAAEAEPEQAAEVSADAPEEAAAPSGGETLSGQQVYQNVCSTCHDAGVAGSPKLTAGAWQGRLEKGKATLVDHAINGFQGDAGVMPAKGGRADLSDEEVTKAVEYMLVQIEGG